MDDDILAVVEASAIRRWMGVSLLVFAGGFLIYAGATAQVSMIWQLVLIGAAVLSFWMADELRRATQFRIELTRTELRDSSGFRLAAMDDVVGLDRGALAFKPSNGFSILLKGSAKKAWRPGLWWRFGRRIGIGGVTSGALSKAMSDQMLVLIAERDQEFSQTT